MLGQNELMYQIMMLDFAVTDSTLFLDTHPNDKEAYRYCKEANEALHRAKNEYTVKYGPLSNRASEPNSYSYAKGPWPWEGVK